MGGRSAHYTTRVAKRLCEHIALGDTLDKALEKEPLGPASVTIFWRWLDEYPQFREMYDRARRLRAELIEDTIINMASAVLRQPKYAPAYKVAADILRWSNEVNARERYGQHTIIEHKHQFDPKRIKEEIKTLEKDLGLFEDIEVEMKELPIPSPAATKPGGRA